MVLDKVASGSSSEDTLKGNPSVEDASNERPEPVRRKARSWKKQWKVIKTASGDMKILTWMTEEPLKVRPRMACPECQKRFQEPTSLKRHVRTHLGKSRNVCMVCRKGFPDASKLKRHQTSLKHISPASSVSVAEAPSAPSAA